MKLKHLIFSLIIASTALTGCKKQWLDINSNPNQLPVALPAFVFTGAVNRTAGYIDPNELGSYWSGQWTQSNTYIISGSQFQYIFNNTNFNYWDTWYDILNDYQFAIDNADSLNQKYVKGPSRIMKALIFQELVDVYGNIPYSQALKAIGNLSPKFDDQKAVYEDLIKLLDTAITDIKANPFVSGSQSTDIVFAGSSTNWVRFANSLKLRLLIRQSKIAGRSAYIIAEINKAAATTEGFLRSGQDVKSNPGYLPSEGKTNPTYNRWGYAANGATQALARYPRPTTFLFDRLKTNNDTFRLKRLFFPVGGETGAQVISNYVAIPFGTSSGYLSQNTSPLGPSLILKGRVNDSVTIMTAAETFFLLAEAKELYAAGVTLPGTSQSYYEQGVRESFRLTGTPDAAATVLLTSGKDQADWTASTNKLQTIWLQKWLAMTNYNGFEAWAEYRRTNYPILPKSASAAANATPPVRLFYPQTELAANGVNVTEQGTIDVFKTKIFWDVD